MASEQGPLEITYQGYKDHFTVTQVPLAFGRASILWLARSTSGDIVCVKAFRETNAPRNRLDEFLNEVIARQTLNHHNILPILDYGLSGDLNPFVVLPYCEGGSLRDLLRGRDFVSPSIFLPILEQVAYAVDFAHENGVIHGDIKPENILFLDKNQEHVCLADFGIAIFFPIAEDISTVESIPVAGSTAYLSPEQIEFNEQTPASDIYALATVAYEALTGQMPFNIRASAYQQMRAKVTGEVIDPWVRNNRLSEFMHDGLIAGLSVEPKNRPRSGMELCQTLRGEKGILNTPSTTTQGTDDDPAVISHERLTRLSQILITRFDESELRTFCFELGVDYDNLSGEGRTNKAIELIGYLVRRDRVFQLIRVGKQRRPDISW